MSTGVYLHTVQILTITRRLRDGLKKEDVPMMMKKEVKNQVNATGTALRRRINRASGRKRLII